MYWWVTHIWEVSPVFLISWIFWVVLSITLHELAHGITAVRRGDGTPIVTGHMTLNPAVHIPRMAWLLFALFGFTWGLMPISPWRLRGRHGEALVAFAGPACNLLQYIVILLMSIAFHNWASGRVSA